MRYEATLTAFDVMDQVWISVRVRSQQSVAEGHPVEVLTGSECIAGVGEDDPRQWLLDALVGLIEAL